jgi:hypothetical protein
MAKFIKHHGRNYQGKHLHETEHNERMNHTTDSKSFEGVSSNPKGACHEGTAGKCTEVGSE